LTHRRGRPYGSSTNDIGRTALSKGAVEVEGVEVSTGHWIGGERVGSASTFSDVSPIDEAPIADVARGGALEVDSAVAAAERGFETWGAMAPKERAEILHRVGELIEDRAEEIARVETRDNGSLLRSMARSVIPRAGYNFHFFADFLEDLAVEDLDTRGHTNHVSWNPSGVAAVITPWNAPLMLATWRIAPALAAGNAVIAKPPEWAPLTASLLADITKEAGMPDGAFNVVQGIGEEAGAALVAHPGVGRVAFTGSVATGRLVAASAGANLTPVSLELGGKAPFVIFGDTDLDAAVKQAVDQFDNAGQVCLAGTRLIVEDAIHAEFVERFTAAAAAIRPGDPRDDGIDLGPLITREHFERVDSFVRRAKADGVDVVFGGGPNQELGGLHYLPTLFMDPPTDAEIVRNEVFGPVLTLQRFAGEEEAIALANDSDYGLSAIVYTGDPGRAERVSAALVAGTVWVNSFYVRDLRAPFGGSRNSGIGREGGFWSFDFYSDVKNVCTAPWT
jgi:aminomuconate-semialdehyde/2-hydroxymuconate-6-semialdehyde dehydrogenase